MDGKDLIDVDGEVVGVEYERGARMRALEVVVGRAPGDVAF